MIEQTLVLVKPDGVQRGLVGKILSRFEDCCLKIIGMRLVYANPELAGNHYANDQEWLRSVGEKSLESAKKNGDKLFSNDPMEIGNKVRNNLIDYLCMSPVVAIAFEGHGAVGKVRKIVGSTNPQDASPGTIRGDYTIDSYALADAANRPIQNLIHASGTREEGKRELALWFKKEELLEWKRADEGLIYRQN